MVETQRSDVTPPGRHSLVHRIAFKSEIGRTHQVNQDAGGAWTWVRSDGVPASLLVVADGVSAGRRSEDVSRHVSTFLLERMTPLLQDSRLDPDTLTASLERAVREANHDIATRLSSSPASSDATTLVAAFALGESGGGVWVGDSRVYRLDGSQAEPLTRDHSWAEGAVSAGIMSYEEAASDPRAHMITRWIGLPDRDDPGVDTFRFTLTPGTTVLCCSDGLYGYFSPPISGEHELARVVAAHGGDLPAAAGHLVDLALERGGHDDITVAALRLEAGTASDASE